MPRMKEGAREHHSYGSYAPSPMAPMNLVKQIRALPGGHGTAEGGRGHQRGPVGRRLEGQQRGHLARPSDSQPERCKRAGRHAGYAP
jgi:hypothetical protein